MKQWIKLLTLFLMVFVAGKASAQSVAAIGTQEYATLQAALDAATDGQTVTLLSNVDATSAMYSGDTRFNLWVKKSITIDGANKTLTVKGRGIGVQGTSGNIDVTFKNITINNTSKGARCIDTRGKIGSLTLDGVTLSTQDAASGDYNQPLTIGGNQSDAATINITNSTIQTNDEGTAYYAITTFNPVNMTISNSTVKGWACIYAKGQNSSAGSAGSVINITGSTLISKNEYSGDSNNFAAFMMEDDNVSINITNTDIQLTNTGTGSTQALIGYDASHTGSISLGEGNSVTFNDPQTCSPAFNANPSSVTLELTGGTFNIDPSPYLSDGYIAVEENGLYTVKQGEWVAEIVGGAKYETLQAAIDAAQTGETITLLKDINMGSAYVNINKGVTIDGDGHTITSSAAAAIEVSGTGNVTISNTKINATAGRGVQVGNVAHYSGKLTINEGTEITVAKRGINVLDVDSGFELNLDNAIVQTNVADPLTTYTTGEDSRGINFSNDPLAFNANITNSEIRGFSYCINVFSGTQNLTVNMNGGKTYGRAAVNNWGKNNKFNLDGVEVHGINNQTGPTEGFACIVENEGSANNTYNINDCSFSGFVSEAGQTTPGSSATQYMISLRGTGTTVIATGSTTYTTNSPARGGIIQDESQIENNKILMDETVANAVKGAFNDYEVKTTDEAPGYTLVHKTPVAQIGNATYYSLQAALNAAHEMTGDVTIELIDNIIEGYSIVHQKEDLNLTIDGKDKTLNGQIIVIGDGRLNGAETLLIQNIKFEGNTSNFYSGNDAFIQVPSTKTAGTPYYDNTINNHAHNITISSCSFTGDYPTSNVVAFKSNSGTDGTKNLTMENVTATNLHSLAQLTAVTNAKFDNCSATLTGSFIGANGGGGTYTISNCTFESHPDKTDGYAYREKSSSTAVATLTNNNFKAFDAIILGSNGTINVESGTYEGHVSKSAGTIAISGGYFSEEFPQEYIAADLVAQGKVCAPATDKEGYFTVGDPHYVAQIGEAKYVSLQAALDAAHEMTGDVTIELIDNIEGYSIVHQKAGLNVTIDGKDKTVAGQIIIDGDGRSEGTDKLTIQNIKFEDDKSHFYTGTDAFVLVPSTKTTGTPFYNNKNNYAHNVTVANCSFTSATSSFDVVGIKVTSGAAIYNVVISDNTASKLHSLAQLNGATGGTITNNTVSGGESFVNVTGGAGEMGISGNTFTSAEGASGYGIRENGSSTAVITLTDNTFTATSAVVLGKGDSQTAGTINVESGTYVGGITKTDAATGKIVISGGKFSAPLGDAEYAQFIAEGKAGVNGLYPEEEKAKNGVGDAVATVTIGEQVTYYASLESAFAAATDGSTVKPLEDITELANNITVGGTHGSTASQTTTVNPINVTFDLNGKTIKSDKAIYLVGGSLNITGEGTIETTNDGVSPVGVRYVKSGAGLDYESKRTLTIGENVTLKGTHYGLNIFGTNEGTIANNIEVNVNGTVEGVLFVLGNLSNAENNIVINVNGSVTATEDVAIALNGNAKVNVVEGAKVTGLAGIEVRAGELNVEGGTITSTASTYTYTPNGSGTTTTGAAIAVAQHNTALPVEVNINGGTLSGVQDIAVFDAQSNDLTDVTVVVKDELITDKTIIPEDFKWVAKEGKEGFSTLSPKDYVAQIGDKKYESLAEAIAAVPENGTETTTILLLANITESASVSNGKNIILDLNEKTLTGNIGMNGGSLTAQNGTIAGTVNVYGSADASATNYNNFTLAADATINAGYGIILREASGTNVAYGATININGAVNGNLWVMGNIKEGNSVINVNNGAKVKGEVVGLNGLATLNVKSGATIEGSETGIEVRAGVLNVEGGAITSTASAYTYNPNGSGTTTTGAAIAVAQHNTALPIEVNVLGGTLSGVHNIAVIDAQSNSLDKVTVTVDDDLITESTLIPDGFVWTSNNNGTSTLKPAVAKIGDTYYATIEDAFAAVTEGSELILLDDVEMTKDYTAAKSFTLTTDGHSLDSQGHHIILNNGVTVTTDAQQPGLYEPIDSSKYAVKEEANGDEYTYTCMTIEDFTGEYVLYDIANEKHPYPTEYEGKHAKKVTYKRTIASAVKNRYQCWYIPIDYTITESDVADMDFFRIHLIAPSSSAGEMTDNEIWMYIEKMKAGETLRGNRPYVVRSKGSKTKFEYVAENVDLLPRKNDIRLEMSTAKTQFDYYGMYGNTKTKDHSLTLYSQDNLFWANKTELLPYRWYIHVTSKQETIDYANMTFFIVEEGETTGISNLDITEDNEIEGIYTIDGKKLDHPMKGLNIIKMKDNTVKKVYIK